MAEPVRYRSFIGGRWREASAYFESEDPFTGEVWALIPRCTKADADEAVESAHRAFCDGPWPAMNPTQRGALLCRLADLVLENAQQLAEVEVRDNGKLMAEMGAQVR